MFSCSGLQRQDIGQKVLQPMQFHRCRRCEKGGEQDGDQRDGNGRNPVDLGTHSGSWTGAIDHRHWGWFSGYGAMSDGRYEKAPARIQGLQLRWHTPPGVVTA